MSVLVINHHGNIGKYGSNNRHFRIGEEVSKLGVNYTLVSSSLRQNNQEYLHSDDIRFEKVSDNFNFISIKTTPKYNNNILRFINYIDFTLKTMKLEFHDKPKHIVGSSVHPFTWIAAYKLAKKYDATFHIEIRDIWPLSLYEDLKGTQRKAIFALFNTLEKIYYPKAKSILVTAPRTSNYLAEFYKVNSKKVFYIPHSVDLEKFHKNIEDYQLNYINKEFDNKFNITYAGTLSPSEGLNNLIDLAEELKFYNDIMIHIFGGGSEEQNIRRMISHKHLKNVKVYGNIKSDEIPYILSKSDLLWCGLKERKAFKYGISKNKFYEYIAAEKPIIFHSNVKYSPLTEVDNAFLIDLNSSAKRTVLDIKNGDPIDFNSQKFLIDNHSDSIIAKKFLEALKLN